MNIFSEINLVKSFIEPDPYMKLLMICFVSSFNLVFAKLMHEQYKAIHAHHFMRNMRAHMEKIIPRTFM